MLEIEALRVAYDKDVVIDGLDWVAGADSAAPVTALLGPSGCGKSTLIRAVAGLETPAAGAIRFDGDDVVSVPTHKRDFGVVFQDGQLFPGRSVESNVAYGLRMRRWPRSAIRDRVAEMLEVVSLPDIAARSVDELSGGQAQRVAVARALAPRPRLLLLDEPLAALDRRLRDRLAVDIAEIVRASGTPTIMVTHDHTEAALMADQVSVMREGRIVQTAPPERLWRTPVDEWTARFLGCTSVVDGVRADGRVRTDLGEVDAGVGGPDGAVRVGLRAESVLAARSGPPESLDGSDAVVTHVAMLPGGPRVRVSTTIGEIDAIARELLSVGDPVALRLVGERLAVIGDDGDRG